MRVAAICLFWIIDVERHHVQVYAEIIVLGTDVCVNGLFLDGAFVAEVFEVEFLLHVTFVTTARDEFFLKDDISVFVDFFHGVNIQVVRGFDAYGSNFVVIALFD